MEQKSNDHIFIIGYDNTGFVTCRPDAIEDIYGYTEICLINYGTPGPACFVLHVGDSSYTASHYFSYIAGSVWSDVHDCT